jgi:hypothetical protein
MSTRRGLLSPSASTLSGLEHAQELGLHLEVELADLVEEERCRRRPPAP